MANKILFADIKSAQIVNSTSRYINSKVLYYSDVGIITFNTYKRKDIALQTDDRLAIIPKGMEYRPDLMSQNLYGTPDLWWKLMEENRIFDILDFKAGTQIRIPSSVV